MENILLSRIFKELFSHRVCSRSRHLQAGIHLTSTRGFSSSLRRLQQQKPEYGARTEEFWRQRYDNLPQEKLPELEKYPLVTSDVLKSRKSRPLKVKMLMRDFIEDSLYNPHYGYFSKQAVIFSPGQPFDFNRMRNGAQFAKQLGQRYTDFEDQLDEKEPNDSRQLWHTPTELFRPYYGEAITRYLVDNYKLSHHPYHDLVIYEMGAGNGTLMVNVLDHIRDIYPDVYERTKYKIIEVSHALASLQKSQLLKTVETRGHRSHVEIINRSIFEWDTYVPEPCYFLALEVFDNFAHDTIRYDTDTGEPFQGAVLIDGEGDFYDFITPKLDHVASRFLRVREAASGKPANHPLNFGLVSRLRDRLPFAQKFSVPEYIPTRLMQFFDILHRYFPHHRLLAGDFHFLPGTVNGINGPAVQTRFQRRTIPVTTPLVHQGYFDILFPTDFKVAEDIYRAITGKLTRVLSQQEFLKHWAYVEDTRTMNGENPMLDWYKNASMIITV